MGDRREDVLERYRVSASIDGGRVTTFTVLARSRDEAGSEVAWWHNDGIFEGVEIVSVASELEHEREIEESGRLWDERARDWERRAKLKRPFTGFVVVHEDRVVRLSILARSFAEAKAEVEAEFGEGHQLWLQDVQRAGLPR